MLGQNISSVFLTCIYFKCSVCEVLLILFVGKKCLNCL